MMTYYSKFIFILLTAGHIYCLQEFPLKDGYTLELLSTNFNETDPVFNGTHIKKLITYNVKGLLKTNETREDLNWSAEIISVSENLHHRVTNCNVYLNSPYLEVSEDMFEVLQKYIRNDICTNSATIDQKTIDLYEDKNNDLKNSVISQLKYNQARERFDTVFDAALVLAKKKLEINDFINLPDMILGSLGLIKYVRLGNLSTITRNRSVIISDDSNVPTVNVLLNVNFELTFIVPKISNLRIRAPKTVAGATMKLDYSKEKCQIVVDDVELDFKNSLKYDFPGALFDTNLLTMSEYLKLSKFFNNGLQPELLKPQMKYLLHEALNKYINCEDL